MDDKQIVELYWQRNEQAIAETAAKYETYCMKISQNILSDRADSEENVNDTYLHAWEAIPPQRPAILSAFLGRIARNLALNRYKAKARRSARATPLPSRSTSWTTAPFRCPTRRARLPQQSLARASARFFAHRVRRCAACSFFATFTASRSRSCPRAFAAARAGSKPHFCARAENSGSI